MAGTQSDGLGDIGFAGAGGAGDNDILGVIDPCGRGEGHDVFFLEAAGR